MSAVPAVPRPDDIDVVELLKLHKLNGVPTLVPYSNFGYAARNCHISAKHRALTAGGSRVHGRAIWRWDVPGGAPGETIIFAEHHSVWEDPSGALIDVTPPPGGAQEVLFIRDDKATIVEDGGDFLIRTDLTNWPEFPRVLRGAPTEDHFWRLSSTDPGANAYASSLNFKLGQIATDDSDHKS